MKSLTRYARENAEVHGIIRALQQTNWNRKQAAEQLKISYKALLYEIREYEIAPAIGPEYIACVFIALPRPLLGCPALPHGCNFRLALLRR